MIDPTFRRDMYEYENQFNYPVVPEGKLPYLDTNTNIPLMLTVSEYCVNERMKLNKVNGYPLESLETAVAKCTY